MELQTKNLKTNRRGLRYWTILLFLVLVITTLFLQSISSLGTSNPILNLLMFGISIYLGAAVFETYRATRALRFPVPESSARNSGLELEEITFPSRDGLRLSGWLSPTRNGAWVILTHGFNSNRLGVLPIARMLARNGYGVLMYDLRAHGRSQGSLSTWGWLETQDLSGALDYLRNRPGVDGRRIGAWGVSLGAQITVRTAAESDGLQAVAVENPGAAVLKDHLFEPGFSISKLLRYPYWWIVYGVHSLLTGVSQPAGVLDQVSHISPHALFLIATGQQDGQRLVHRLYATAGEPKSLWEIPEARHAGGASARPEEYERRLAAFFDGVLLADGGSANE